MLTHATKFQHMPMGFLAPGSTQAVLCRSERNFPAHIQCFGILRQAIMVLEKPLSPPKNAIFQGGRSLIFLLEIPIEAHKNDKPVWDMFQMSRANQG